METIEGKVKPGDVIEITRPWLSGGLYNIGDRFVVTEVDEYSGVYIELQGYSEPVRLFLAEWEYRLIGSAEDRGANMAPALEQADSHARICSNLAEQYKSDPVLSAALTDAAATIRALLAERDTLREALETMVEMIEMKGFGFHYAMDLARTALGRGKGEE